MGGAVKKELTTLPMIQRDFSMLRNKNIKNDFFKNHNTFCRALQLLCTPQALVEKVEGEIPKHIGIYVYLGDKESGVLNYTAAPKTVG